jgi:hypothetical protein
MSHRFVTALIPVVLGMAALAACGDDASGDEPRAHKDGGPTDGGFSDGGANDGGMRSRDSGSAGRGGSHAGQSAAGSGGKNAGTAGMRAEMTSSVGCPVLDFPNILTLPSCCTARGMCGIETSEVGGPGCLDLATAAERARMAGASAAFPAPRGCDEVDAGELGDAGS